MRITAGKYKGRVLKSPKSRTIRPMMDKVRKALFDSLGLKVEGAKVLDLFCGTGALGLEALSRGAEKVVFVDQSGEALSLVKENLASLGEKNAEIKRLTLPNGLKKLKPNTFDLIFITPPYGTGLALKTLKEIESFLSEDGVVVVEENTEEDFPNEMGNLLKFREKTYGQTRLHFYRRR
ncbi:methyltransferase [Thermodesulfatator indicus DSM 15286]|uniref:Methyltransferase n=1 Tax=Thermodesulfatator indicus (strain DSM 15286 / JCM 11887 / CIR29812) TaxID=667014 RepID=F8A8I8_THEID|nr:16S rRNA (guanine(966)-N(2))-methyltransferase RsmD [Thermodesulfatator indicus]AEH45074.1 methyltransferase [Thermodesulfatator indicus DSM 15286]